MVDNPFKWPAYSTGPDDSIFALGVVSANYVELELAVLHIFSAILGTGEELSKRIMYKMSNEKTRERLMKEGLTLRTWPPEVNDLVLHFINARRFKSEVQQGNIDGMAE
jgi:hypothetical protein